MSIEITAFKWVPDFAKGFVKDLRVRWALEEAGLAYTQHLIDAEEQASEPYLRRQPFGQVPVYKDDEVELFESGGILISSTPMHLGPQGFPRPPYPRSNAGSHASPIGSATRTGSKTASPLATS